MPGKSLKIAFIMDAPEKLDLPSDSSLFLIKMGIERKHKVSYLIDSELYVKNGEAFGTSYEPKIDGNSIKLENVKDCKLKDFDVILLRKDPPFNMDYIYMTYILELVENDVLCINKPSSVRNTNEKFYINNFPEFIPATLISKSTSAIKKFAKEHNNKIVVKPLDQKGGSGVFFIGADDLNQNEILKTATSNGSEFIVAQEFLEGILKNGDKRIMLLDGEIVNALLRIPAKGDFRGNISSGAKAIKTEITEREQEICSKLAPILKAEGLSLVGLDFIDEKLTEINVTSPIIGFDLYPENGRLIYEFMENSV